MSSSYKFSYFPLRGRGELSRIIIAAGGLDSQVQQEIVTFEQWPQLKPTTPSGCLPVLEDLNAKVSHHQSGVIARLLAKKAKLLPQGSDEEEFKAEALVYDAADIHNANITAYFSANRDENMKKFKEGALTKYLNRMEQVLKDAGGKYFIGGALSWADLAVFDILDSCSAWNTSLGSFPTLSQFHASLSEHENLKQFLSKPRQSVIA